MRHSIPRLIALAILVFAGTSTAQIPAWDIDPVHSTAQFSVRHLMVSNVKGEFGKVTGEVHYDARDISTASAQVLIDTSTIDTRNPKRDAHLKSPDFLDVEKFPSITFHSKKVTAAGPGNLKLTGDLTMHGVTKEVVLDVEGPSAEVRGPGGRARIGASATTRINRKDFGMVWNRPLELGGVVVSDEVKITLEVELISKADPPKPPN